MAEKLPTDKAVKNARVQGNGRDSVLRDGGGLEMRVYRAGGKIWQLRYQHAGKRRIMRIGEYRGVSLKDARRAADDAHKLLDRGIDPQVHAEDESAAQQEAERIARMNRPPARPLLMYSCSGTRPSCHNARMGPICSELCRRTCLPSSVMWR
ncbi:Arm DNA-binding domain-containing protein [Acidithiobacillus sp. M4-SHS-6]|uniref:Arm DNA-binding domain-containing protein n=1 Tax=Acidithiobacillus sp. M4-SHS-6 TaxID=3383024 RepID=UPI0039BE3E15